MYYIMKIDEEDMYYEMYFVGSGICDKTLSFNKG